MSIIVIVLILAAMAGAAWLGYFIGYYHGRRWWRPECGKIFEEVKKDAKVWCL